ncbi:D-2-hydroxyacid dehydrogenase [Aquibacillus koreensis]|uniref:D-2-hydroxyacid dehydrogenase n=1 Tax=Aquibacillus koreensis TaxID=279446 RepID=A0A9X3WQT9_9BACI|nr:D-2-hydroxyacid dehydrogenase [Aquibacillus koreensis]MCT2534362.1 D-2-hydroxyacid dehydrogenase [Aquibacillus koreensis]MDC3421669.1 D-2-hydroxyacid dehydrogenase [Aquibacillus koreensis]
MLVLSTTTEIKQSCQSLIDTYPDIEFQFYENIEQAMEELPEAEVLVTYGEDLNEEIIAKATKLKWIMVISAGLEEMPLAAISERNILVTNARGIHKVQMAEYAIGMLLQVYRNTKVVIENQQQHHWDRNIPVDEISRKTMLVVGAGAIGQELARLAKAFRMKTIGVSKSGAQKEHFDQVHTMDELSGILPEVDFVISILPSTDETIDYYQAEHFSQMKKTAVFLNMGRGNAVKSEILIDALDQKELAHVVLDVFEQEPLPKNHPLWGHPNVTLTPHISSRTPYYIPRAIEIFEQNFKKYMLGETNYINKIDLKRGY